jgi:sigma-B regulation protein RsbU (phosphoserine phosphatase)
MPNPVFEEERLKIRPGDKLLFYTDGIVEQRNSDGVMFGQERLKMSFYETVSQRKSAVLQEVFNEFKGFSKGVNFCDDITMLLLEF